MSVSEIKTQEDVSLYVFIEGTSASKNEEITEVVQNTLDPKHTPTPPSSPTNPLVDKVSIPEADSELVESNCFKVLYDLFLGDPSKKES
ncbi:MAG: hypothetical protein V4489_04200 [Chlamydiota bacterium]